MAAFSHVADSRKRSRALLASPADDFCLDQSNNGFHSASKQRGFEIRHLCSFEVCMCVSSANVAEKRNFNLGNASYTKGYASSSPRCVTDYEDTADSSMGSSCCSSFPGYESSLTEAQAHHRMSGTEDEAESFCGGDGASEMDIACFLHDDEVCDDANKELFSFNPDTIFFNDAYADCSSGEDAPCVGCSAENGSWFLNDLDGQDQAFLNEVLDQEWMAAAVANLEKLNDTLSADSCVLHLLESDHDTGKDF